jgi:large subunit ribosomal protein L9
MNIILLEDNRTLGKKGQVVKVSDGYGRNLISKKQAIEATPKNINDWKLRQKHEEKLAAERLAEAKKLAEEMKGMSVSVTLKAGEGGKVFGSVSSKEIAQAMKEQLKLGLDKKKLVLDEPIKSFGTFEVPVKLHPEVSGTIRVKVTEES